jgi:hypothetical protein
MGYLELLVDHVLAAVCNTRVVLILMQRDRSQLYHMRQVTRLSLRSKQLNLLETKRFLNTI